MGFKSILPICTLSFSRLTQSYLSRQALKKYGKGLKEFLHLPTKVLFSAVRDPSQYSEVPFSDAGLNVFTRSGMQKITPEEFMELQNSLLCDFCECPALDVPFYIKTKKMRRSYEISLKWLDKCISHNPQVQYPSLTTRIYPYLVSSPGGPICSFG